MRNRHSTGIWAVYKNKKFVGRVIAHCYEQAMRIARSKFGGGNFWITEVEA